MIKIKKKNIQTKPTPKTKPIINNNKIDFPYVVQPVKIENYFIKIRESISPKNMTQSFLTDVFFLTSSNDVGLIRLLKCMKFLNDDGSPTELYDQYRLETENKSPALAEGIKNGYNKIYEKYMELHKLTDEQIKSIMIKFSNHDKTSSTISLMYLTYIRLKELADFSTHHSEIPVPQLEHKFNPENPNKKKQNELGLSVTLYLNMPDNAKYETYRNIIKALKDEFF